VSREKEFNDKMSLKNKYPRHINMKKGGMVKRFADGGSTEHAFSDPGTALGGPANSTNNSNVQTTSNTLGGNLAGALGLTSGFQAGGANLQVGTNSNQLNNAYTGAQTGLANTQNIAGTLAPGAAQGVANQGIVQQQLLNQLNGTGPNPARAALNMNTAANVNQQAALMAGQRGAGQNAGLIAREAAQQGAGIQQQGVAQNALLQQQQQIAAQQGLAGLAGQQIGQAGTGAQAYNTAQQNEQGILQGANSGMNSTLAQQQASINATNAATAQANASGIGGLIGGVGSAVGSIFSSLAEGGEVQKMADGGNLGWGGNYNQTPGGGGSAPMASFSVPGKSNDLSNGLSDAGEGIADYIGKKPGGSGGITQFEGNVAGGPGDTGSPAAYFGRERLVAHGGQIRSYEHHYNHVQNYFNGGPTGQKVDALVSPGEVYLNPHQVKKVIHEGADPEKIGHKFPGVAKKPGKDSYDNDVTPASLDEGGVVIDLETLKKKNPLASRRFVHKAVAKHMKSPKRKS
jgi:hypothetical protein